jgi:glyoxylase-like metal-dependent hydrolase (beta-lactamase superfamily II)
LNEKKHQPIKITPHLYQLGTYDFPAYLSLGKKGMLIEGGTSGTFEIIIDQINELGIDPSTITSIVLPHTHPDHVGAVPRIREYWPHLKIISGSIAAKFLAKDSFVKRFLPTDTFISELLVEKNLIAQKPSDLDTYRFETDEIVDEGDEIDLGDGIVWKVYTAPGHCPDHIALFEKKESSLTLGDIAGFYDPNLDVFWPNYFTSLEDYCNSIRKMAALPVKRALLSHHGVIEGEVKTFLENALKATESFHNELLSRLDAGEDKAKIAKEKADWVSSFGPLAPYEAIVNLNDLLMNVSLAEREKDLFFFP